ncbi:hypothetical protein LINGRAHAP2_LOCUS34569 [Linum grandiflorum]
MLIWDLLISYLAGRDLLQTLECYMVLYRGIMVEKCLKVGF